jgi:hypothetical protein
MAYPHITNAIAKMEREGRTDEPQVLASLHARRDDLDAEREAAESSAPVAEAVEGHNNPPEATTFEAIKSKIDDIRIEALNWMDGAEIENAAQAAEVEKLLGMLRAAKSEAEKAKDAEKKPLLDASNEIQDRYNTLIGKTQKVTGTALVIEGAILAARTKWLNKVEAERKAEVARLAKIAEEQAEKAREAFRSSIDTSDLEQREDALAEIDKARQAAFDLSKVAKAETKGLKTVYDVQVTDAKALAAWFWVNRNAELVGFMTDEARRTVRASNGSAAINGVTVIDERVAR